MEYPPQLKLEKTIEGLRDLIQVRKYHLFEIEDLRVIESAIMHLEDLQD